MIVCATAIGCSKPERGPDSTAAATPAAIAFPTSWPYPSPTRVSRPHTAWWRPMRRSRRTWVPRCCATVGMQSMRRSRLRSRSRSCFPAAGNLGGGGFLVVHMGDGREAALDFRETAPGAATRDMYIGANGHADDRSITGPLAAGVPGSVAGLWEAHERFGSRPWAELLAPAIALADQGFVVDSDFAGCDSRRQRATRALPCLRCALPASMAACRMPAIVGAIPSSRPCCAASLRMGRRASTPGARPS